VESPSQKENAAITRTSAEWFATEVHPHEPSLKAYLRGNFPSVRDVDDVVHESYLKLFKEKAIKPIESAKALLFTVARHLALDKLRSAQRSPVDAMVDLSTVTVRDRQSEVATSVSKNEKVKLLTAAIDSLPKKCREVVVLRKLHLLSQREVAKRLNISEKGVENQLARGIERCRIYLQKRGIETLFEDER
jgi:RNA polymerase sigma-70 factor (ECF subfamily)